MRKSLNIYRSTSDYTRNRRRGAMRISQATMEAMEARCLLAAALAPDHIVVVIEQDRAANAVGDITNMPYFNQLAATGLVYTNAHGVGHPSEPNTLAIYSGSTQGISDNGNLHTFTAPNLAESLNSKLVGANQYLSFAGYVENLPQNGDGTTQIAGDPNNPLAPPDLYERNVNPMAQFTNVGQQGLVTLTNAQVNMTFANFPTTVAGYASLPTVSYVIPNGLHNTHGSNEQAPFATDPSEYEFLRSSADTWLANNLDSYLQWAKTHNSLLIVISDEEETDTHPSTTTTMIVNGDQRLFVAGQNANSVNHYDLLRTITDMYGVAALGDTAGVSGLATDAQGRLAPSATGLGATTTSLISSLPAAKVGQSVTFTATVTPNAGGVSTPTGTITFKDGPAILGTGSLNAAGQATFTTSTLSAGSHLISAAYGGDSAFTTSTSPTITQAVGVPNDNFANRTVIAGTTVATTGSNAGATKEVGEPNHANNAGGKSVWWTWTAPSSGTLTIDTIGSSFDTTLGVYTGTAVSALTLVAGDDDGGGGNASKVSFAATAGTTYQIAVDGYGGLFGNIALNVNLSTAVAPVNDNFASRAALSGTTVAAAGANVGATKEIGEPNHAGDVGGKSVWWIWTAPSAGTVTIDTVGSNFDTTLGVYTGNAVSALTLVKGDDDSGGGNTSKVSFAVTAGTVYQIAVDGYAGRTGNIALNVNLSSTLAAANDNFTSRTVLSGATVVTTGSNVGATKEAGEPNHANNAGGRSVWWTWTAPSSGTATIDTIGSNFDTTLGVYTGTSVSALTLVGGDDDSGGNMASKMSFAATAGTVYQIAVDGYAGLFGNIALNVSMGGVVVVAPQAPTGVAASNGTFTDRVQITWTTAANAAGYEVWRNTANDSAAATKINAADVIGTSYDDATATAGTTYWYWVKAKNTGGTSAFSTSSSGFASSTVTTPVNLALGKPATSSSQESAAMNATNAVDGNTSTRWASGDWNNMSTPKWLMVDLGSVSSISRVNITWEWAAASAYQVQVSNDGAAWTTISSVTNGTEGQTSITGLNAAGRYVRIYCTAATTAWGYSIYELQVMGTATQPPPQQQPQAPTGVAASNGTFTDRVRVTWTASANAAGYEVWRNAANDSTAATKINAADVTGTSYDDTTATTGTTYWYWAKAKNSSGTSGFSASSSGYASVAVVAPLAPTGVAASNGTFTDRVRIIWTAATNAAGYEVWRYTTNSSAAATKLNAADVTGTSYDDTTATAGTTYWYWVKAKNSAGPSGFSTGSSGFASSTVTTPVNLALGRPATSSSQESATTSANFAVDGSGTTRWASGDWNNMSSPKWLMVDLGAVHSISAVSITWEWAAASTYQVQVSNDGTTWTTISSQTNGAQGQKNITGLNASGRYVRIYCTQGATAWGYSIYELQVMGV